jgi:adenylate cyclase
MEDDKDRLDEQILGLTLENLKLRGLLEEHLGKQITDDILDGTISTKLGGERRRMGILMVDIRNFTPYAEREDPARVVDFLNRFFKAMTACIERHDGRVDKFIGDAILAQFEPQTVPGMASCAREMVRLFASLEPPEKTGIGVGMTLGEVVIGCVGSGRKVDFTVIGPAVNLAARLAGIAKAGEVLLDGDVKAALDPKHGVHSTGHKAIKGFTHAIEIFRLE